MQSTITIFTTKCGFSWTNAMFLAQRRSVGVLDMLKQVQRLSLSFLNPVPLPCCRISCSQQDISVRLKRSSQDNQLNDINPALAALNPRNKGLMTLQSVSQLGLRETRSFAGVRQRLAQCFVPITSDRLCHIDANPLSHQR